MKANIPLGGSFIITQVVLRVKDSYNPLKNKVPFDPFSTRYWFAQEHDFSRVLSNVKFHLNVEALRVVLDWESPSIKSFVFIVTTY